MAKNSDAKTEPSEKLGVLRLRLRDRREFYELFLGGAMVFAMLALGTGILHHFLNQQLTEELLIEARQRDLANHAYLLEALEDSEAARHAIIKMTDVIEAHDNRLSAEAVEKNKDLTIEESGGNENEDDGTTPDKADEELHVGGLTEDEYRQLLAQWRRSKAQLADPPNVKLAWTREGENPSRRVLENWFSARELDSGVVGLTFIIHVILASVAVGFAFAAMAVYARRRDHEYASVNNEPSSSELKQERKDARATAKLEKRQSRL